MPNQREDPFAEMRRKIEQLLGYPHGAYDPASNFLRDMERINRALGEGFKMFQDVIGPQALLDRIEALHPDQAPLRLPQALRDIMNLPKQPPDRFFRR